MCVCVRVPIIWRPGEEAEMREEEGGEEKSSGSCVALLFWVSSRGRARQLVGALTPPTAALEATIKVP